jgi:hypothetical protein
MPDDRPTIEPIPLADWLRDLGTTLELPEGVTEEEQVALLDIARIAAHTSERIAAPLTTFMAGIACAALPPAERGTALRSLASQLETK